MSELYEAAQEYARQGIPVFPVHGIVDGVCTCQLANECNNPGKHPATRNGFKDATDNLKTIERWWSQNPEYNIGIPAEAIGTVIDVDSDRDKPGEISWAKFEEEYGPIPATRTVRTGSGGFHVWFRVLESLPTERLKEFPGIDFQASGAYVVCPPSRHISGGVYHFIDKSDVAAAPYKWVAAVKDRRDAAKQYAMAVNMAPTGVPDTPKQSDVRIVEEDLRDLDPDMDRSDWVRVGQALHSTNWLYSFELFDKFSQGGYWECPSEKYNEKDTRTVWDSFRNDKAIRVTLSTIEYMAAEARHARRPDASHIKIDKLLENARKKPQRSAEESGPPELEHEHIRFLSPEMLANQAPPKWRVDKLFPLAEVAFMVYGPPSAGKTFFVIEDMVTSMLGKPFMGRENLSQGGSVYLCLEGDVSLRVLAALHRHGVTPQEANNRILVGEGSLNLSNEEEIGALHANLTQYRADGGEFQTLYIDTFSRAFGGDDENSSAEVTKAINAAERLARSLNCSVGLVHHTSKNPNGKERGSSAIRGAMNTMVKLGGGEGNAPRLVEAEKQKNGVEGEVGYYTLVNYEVPREVYSADFRSEVRKEDLQTAVLEMAESGGVTGKGFTTNVEQKAADEQMVFELIDSMADEFGAPHMAVRKAFISQVLSMSDEEIAEVTAVKRFSKTRDNLVADDALEDIGSGKSRILRRV